MWHHTTSHYTTQGGGKAAVLVDAVLPNDPAQLLTPLLWDEAQVKELLRGSPVADEALQRRKAIDEEWQALQQQAPDLLPLGALVPMSGTIVILVSGHAQSRDGLMLLYACCITVCAGRHFVDHSLINDHPATDAWNAEQFATAVAAVLASAVYLPSADCLALIPGVSTLKRTGTSAGCFVDYDLDRGEVVLTAQGPIKYARTRGGDVLGGALCCRGVHVGKIR